eukprot:TRINITY_DN9693_c0_g1_i1.p1 TRINITY_DN9693_c0_g1~~TRINITY_DN9693_c0_g1_i1.p1  ORF type:complete len:224 (+),score=45.06 TRINITY_DN9693_c0_g1_i1:63-734(+)
MSSVYRDLSILAVGAVGGIVVYRYTQTCDNIENNKKTKTPVEEEDPNRVIREDMSMLYAKEEELCGVREEARHLPVELYGEVVRRLPVVCVDVVIQNKQGEVLTVHRGMEPVKGYWWWPGGRMFKGETFFTAALRKAKQETNLTCTPVRLLGIYNTLFPTSSWDNPTTKGTQTINAVVLCTLPTDASVKLDSTSSEHRWISPNARKAANAGYDRYIVEQLRRL